MNKIIVALALLGVGSVGVLLAAGQGAGDWVLVEAPVSSGTVNSVSLPGHVRSIWASSDTVNQTNWFIMCDTIPVNQVTVAQLVALQKTPSFQFKITTASLTTNTDNRVAYFGEDGVFFANAPYLYKTAATSGQALRVFLELKR